VIDMQKLINVKETILGLLKDERGLTTVEYAVAGGLIALAVVGAFQALGLHVGNIITQIDGLLP
jgi:pilus assembly protein Flp/PilA